MKMKPEEKAARAICRTIDEISCASTGDFAPSSYDIPGIWYEIDPSQPNSFVIYGSVGIYSKKKPRFRVTVEKI